MFYILVLFIASTCLALNIYRTVLKWNEIRLNFTTAVGPALGAGALFTTIVVMALFLVRDLLRLQGK